MLSARYQSHKNGLSMFEFSETLVTRPEVSRRSQALVTKVACTTKLTASTQVKVKSATTHFAEEVPKTEGCAT